MVYWAGAGLLAGWVVSRELRGSRYGALALIVGIVALVSIAAARRFETETLIAGGLFWIAAQIAWFMGSLFTDARRPQPSAEEAESPLG